jgi:acyl carrier protein phosphodiesterase
MNWLAHLLLAEPDPAFRIGALLPDLMRVNELSAVPAMFQAGIRQHKDVDAFTDSHPIVKRSIARIGARWRRFGGILIDVFYDHFLTLAWADYANQPLAEFVDAFHSAVPDFRDALPAQAFERLEQIRDDRRLLSYGTIGGIESALHRIGERFRSPIPLADATGELTQNTEALRTDFHEFFPLLRKGIG